MVNSGTYAEIVDRHVELYNLVAIAQLAESLDRVSFELAFRIVPLDWWQTQLPDRPSTAEELRT